MSKRTSTTRALAGVALAFLLAAVSARAETRGYLPIVGPPPLRIEVAMARTFVFPPPRVNLPKPVAPPVESSSTETNAGAEQPPLSVPDAVTNSVASPEPLPQAGSIGEPVTPINSHASDPASDMLLVTPQMIAELLKRPPGATNGTAAPLALPAPVIFSPPTEKISPSSRATYKTE